MKPTGLSGFTLTRNCISQDYCFIECIDSLLPICDEVVVSDAESTDGTLHFLLDWAAREPKLKIRLYKWRDPKGDMKWFTDWINAAREELSYSMMLQLDSDEVLAHDADTLGAIQRAVNNTNAIAFNRLNFVRDPLSLIPEGECCGKHVVRLGPSHLWMPSDEPHHRGEVHILDMSHLEPRALIYHLGFMRRREAFFKKARVVLGAFFNEFDARLARAETEGKHPFEEFPWWNRLAPFPLHYGYPPSVRRWLEQRGYTVP